MAKFITSFPIGSMSGNNGYLGLSPDSVEGRIISTLDQNIVFRIELSNQKQIKSWTSEQKLSHKVVYDFKSKKYVGVFDHQKLRCWGEETTKIEKGKIKLPQPIEEIISFDNKHTILVYKDGTCESLENRVDGLNRICKPIVATQTHQITKIACFNTRDNHVMLTYFVKSNRTPGKLELVYFLLNDDDLTPNYVAKVRRIEITKDETTLSAFTVVEGDQFPSVMKIGTDKRIYMLPLNCDDSEPSQFGAHSATLTCLRVDRSLTVANVSKNCIAIYGANPTKDGALLILFNTVHFVVDAVQEFKVHLGSCRLWAIGKHILMADGQRLLCTRYYVSQGKLAEAIGSKRSTDWERLVNTEGINEEGFLEDATSLDRVGEAIHQQQENSTKKIYKNDEVKPVFEIFEGNLLTLLRFGIPFEIVHGHSAQDTKIRSVVHPNDKLYDSVINQLFSDLLESRGASETEITEHQIPMLIKADLPKELDTCLRKYTNVSERMLAKSLKYFVSMPDSDDKLAYINQIFACSFEPELIKHHLRTELNLEDAIYLLDAIHRDLVDEEFALDEAPQYNHRFDSDAALINWFVVILEAHYQQFLLSRDPTLNDFILKWKELIVSFVGDIRELKPVTAKVVNLVNGKFKQNDNASSKWYSVEKVKLY